MPSSELGLTHQLSVISLWYGSSRKPDFAELSRGLSECSFPQAWGSATLESDPAKLLPQLLDQLIALGQTAHQIRHALGGNGHRPEKISEVIQQLTEGGDHAH